MPSFIVKPNPDRDFYVRWSTIVDDATACGSRAELTEYLTKFKPYWEADPARFERADETGTSGYDEAEGFLGWDTDEFFINQFEEPRFVRRVDLEAYASARCANDEPDEALQYTYKEDFSG